MKKFAPIASLAILALATAAHAYLFVPTSVADALTRADVWVKNHPNQPDAYFFLARIHGSAWAKGDTGKEAEVQIANFGNDQSPPFFVPWDSLMYQRPPDAPITNEATAHLIAAVTNYHHAVILDAKNPLFQLGYAWACEQAASCNLEPPPEIITTPLTPEQSRQIAAAISQLSDPDFTRRDQAAQTLAAVMPAAAQPLLAVHSQDPEVAARISGLLNAYWLAEVIAHYRQAYACALETDLKAETFRNEADHTISMIAGQRLLALLPPTAANSKERERIQESLKLIGAKPPAMIAY